MSTSLSEEELKKRLLEVEMYEEGMSTEDMKCFYDVIVKSEQSANREEEYRRILDQTDDNIQHLEELTEADVEERHDTLSLNTSQTISENGKSALEVACAPTPVPVLAVTENIYVDSDSDIDSDSDGPTPHNKLTATATATSTDTDTEHQDLDPFPSSGSKYVPFKLLPAKPSAISPLYCQPALRMLPNKARANLLLLYHLNDIRNYKVIQRSSIYAVPWGVPLSLRPGSNPSRVRAMVVDEEAASEVAEAEVVAAEVAPAEVATVEVATAEAASGPSDDSALSAYSLRRNIKRKNYVFSDDDSDTCNKKSKTQSDELSPTMIKETKDETKKKTKTDDKVMKKKANNDEGFSTKKKTKDSDVRDFLIKKNTEETGDEEFAWKKRISDNEASRRKTSNISKLAEPQLCATEGWICPPKKPLSLSKRPRYKDPASEKFDELVFDGVSNTRAKGQCVSEPLITCSSDDGADVCVEVQVHQDTRRRIIPVSHTGMVGGMRGKRRGRGNGVKPPTHPNATDHKSDHELVNSFYGENQNVDIDNNNKKSMDLMSCPMCSKLFPKNEIEDHAIKCVDEEEITVKQRQCPACYKAVPPDTDMEDHKRKCIEDIIPIPIKKKRDSVASATATNNNTFICSNCKLPLPSRTELNTHMRTCIEKIFSVVD